ncbi:MAG: D-alanyl-D-alanine carboxypeptidase/D-alanyl-D-alanine-endopeptidase [Myxococcota bacterium]
MKWWIVALAGLLGGGCSAGMEPGLGGGSSRGGAPPGSGGDDDVGGAGGSGVAATEDPFEMPPPPPPLSAAALDAIAADVDGILGGLSGPSHSVLITGADTGQVVYAREPDQALKPASNTKLFSSAVAFARLGEDHRHETVVYATVAPANGVVAGDLIIMGDHDYTWSPQFYPAARWPLDRLAEDVAALGITEVQGAVQARFEHLYDGFQFATFNAASHRADVATQFRSALQAAGVATGAASTSAGDTVPDGAVPLATWRSLPLHVAASPVNRISHNEFADVLSRHVGSVLGGSSSYGAGADAVTDLLTEAGLDVGSFTLNDGSGLSHNNRVSARLVVGLFELMAQRPEGLAWERTFTVAGVKGTIGGRMSGPDTFGRFRGKTGTLSGVIALSGVLDHRHDGQRYHLAMLMQGVTNNTAARSAHNAMVATIARDHRSEDSDRPVAPTLSMVRGDGNAQTLTAVFSAVDGAEGYLVWRSRDGRRWPREAARFVTTTQHRTVPFDGDDHLFVRVSAVGAAGESDPSDTYVARLTDGAAPILLVDGNDRWQGQPAPENPTAQAHDFLVPYADAIRDTGDGRGFDSCDNDAVIAGDCVLDDYDLVMWSLGEESVTFETFDAGEQTLVQAYRASGGALVVAGAELAWDLGAEGDPADAAFLEDVLRVTFAGDDAATRHVRHEGVPVSFLTPDRMVVSFPDQLDPASGAEAFLDYLGGDGGVAGVRDAGGVVVLGFPFASVAARDDREALMAEVLEYLSP